MALSFGLLGACEVAFRLLEKPLGVDGNQLFGARQYLRTGSLSHYEPRAHTMFQRRIGKNMGNSFGYSDVEWKLARTPGVPRIVCMGGSTTEGGNHFGRAGSYPFLLEQALERATQRDFEVMNAGIAAWTTAEAVPAWFLTLQDFAPDVVLLHFAINDVHPRLRADFRADYSHWRIPIPQRSPGLLHDWLLATSDLYVFMRVRGMGVPDMMTISSRPGPWDPAAAGGKLPAATALPFRRNIRSIGEGARTIGATVALMTMPIRPELGGNATSGYAVGEHNQQLRELCTERGYLLVDAERVFAARPELAREFSDICHVSPEGNRVKAEAAAEVLLAEWVPTLPTDGLPPQQTAGPEPQRRKNKPGRIPRAPGVSQEPSPAAPR